jgi:hypothetical protein
MYIIPFYPHLQHTLSEIIKKPIEVKDIYFAIIIEISGMSAFTLSEMVDENIEIKNIYFCISVYISFVRKSEIRKRKVLRESS